MNTIEIKNSLDKYLNKLLHTIRLDCIVRYKDMSYTYAVYIPEIGTSFSPRRPELIEAGYKFLECLFSLAKIPYELQIHQTRCNKYIITVPNRNTSIKKLELLVDVLDTIYRNGWHKTWTIRNTEDTISFEYDKDTRTELLSIFPDLQLDKDYAYICKNKINSIRRHFNQSLALCKIQGYALPEKYDLHHELDLEED